MATLVWGGLDARPAQGAPMSTSPEQAYDLGEIPSARSVGMGGALSALGVSTPALYLNPANMALARVYHFEALAAGSPEAQRQTYGLAIVDSVLNSARLSGGIGGTWSEFDPSGLHRQWTDVRAAAAMPLGDYLAFGVTGRWLQVDQSVAAGPFGPSLASDGTPNGSLLNTLTFDVGATGCIAYESGVDPRTRLSSRSSCVTMRRLSEIAISGLIRRRRFAPDWVLS